MPKAILELEKMPNACYGDGCPFFKITGICDILSSRNNYMPVLVPSEGKHPDCPLKEVEEDEGNRPSSPPAPDHQKAVSGAGARWGSSVDE